MKTVLALKLSEVAFIMLINVNMPAIVGMLTFISMINSINLNMKKKFNNLGAWFELNCIEESFFYFYTQELYNILRRII